MTENALTKSSGQALIADSPVAGEQAVDRRRWLPFPKTAPRIRGSVILACVLAAFLILPIIGLVQRAALSGTILQAIQRPIVYEAVRLSMLTSSAVLVLSLVFGMPLALVLARRKFPGVSIVDTLVDLPIVLPPAVAGLALLLTFGRRGMLGPALDTLGVQLPFTTAAVVIASFFVAAPFFVRVGEIGISQRATRVRGGRPRGGRHRMAGVFPRDDAGGAAGAVRRGDPVLGTGAG